MIIEAVRQALQELPVEIFDEDATGATVDHYILVLGATISRGREEDLGGQDAQSDLIIRAVGVNARHARKILILARERLARARVETAAGWVSFRFDSCPRSAQVDTVKPAAGTNTNRVFVDDEYTVFCETKNV